MMIDLPNTTTNKVAKKLISSRRTHGVVALSRVLTLVVITREGFAENAIEAANLASREHPAELLWWCAVRKRAKIAWTCRSASAETPELPKSS